jgi:hypothetical protein
MVFLRSRMPENALQQLDVNRRLALTMQVLVVLSYAVEGSDDEFNRWYSGTHLGEVLKLEGYVGAQRFKLSDSQWRASSWWAQARMRRGCGPLRSISKDRGCSSSSSIPCLT